MSYDYAIDVLREGDGDTFDARLDLGFHASIGLRLRILGLRAREDGAGRSEKRHVHTWLETNRPYLRALTHKPKSTVNITPDGSFGRWLAEIYASHTGERLADFIIAAMDREGVDVRWYS